MTMTIEFTARHFHAPENLKEYAYNEVQRIYKIFDRATHCHIILAHEHNAYTTEINLSVPQKNLNVKETTNNITKSIDNAVNKMIKRVEKVKGKTYHNS